MMLQKAVLIVFLTIAFSQTLIANDDNWIDKGEKNKVQLYWRDYPKSSIPEFKAITVVDASIATVLGVLLDIEACPKWIHQCKKAFVIDQPHPDEQIIYQINSIPFATDRDAVMSAKLRYSDNADNITIAITNAMNYCGQVNKPRCADIANSKYLRLQSLDGEYRLHKLDENRTEVTWQQHLELGGNLPAWIVRSKLDDLAYKSLYGLRQLAGKPEYQHLKLHIDNSILSVVSAN